jgi:hypothetical protein
MRAYNVLGQAKHRSAGEDGLVNKIEIECDEENWEKP